MLIKILQSLRYMILIEGNGSSCMLSIESPPIQIQARRIRIGNG